MLASGLGVADLTLGDETVHLVVDTGATITLVDARFRHHLGPIVGRSQATTADSVRSVSLYQGERGRIGDLDLNEPIIACVDLGPDLRGEGVDGLLGMSFLSRYCVDFDWEAGKARISGKPPKTSPGRVEDGARPTTRAGRRC